MCTADYTCVGWHMYACEHVKSYNNNWVGYSSSSLSLFNWAISPLSNSSPVAMLEEDEPWTPSWQLLLLPALVPAMTWASAVISAEVLALEELSPGELELLLLPGCSTPRNEWRFCCHFGVGHILNGLPPLLLAFFLPSRLPPEGETDEPEEGKLFLGALAATAEKEERDGPSYPANNVLAYLFWQLRSLLWYGP